MATPVMPTEQQAVPGGVQRHAFRAIGRVGTTAFARPSEHRGEAVAAIKPCDRTSIERQAMAAQTAHLVGKAGGPWLVPVIEMAALASGGWPRCPAPAPIRWACFPRIPKRTPGMNATLVRAARHFSTTTLQRWGVAERSEDIVIVVSELLTNAIRHALPGSGTSHAGWPIRLGLLQPGNYVVCAVADPSKVLPVARQPDYEAETGRGLHVIAALSDHWGCTTPGDTGKALWAMFSVQITLPAARRWCDSPEQEARGPATGRR